MSSKSINVVESVISPISYDQFFDEFFGQKPLVLTEENAARLKLAGENPRQQLLSDFKRYAPTLTSHSRSPKGPAPTPRAVDDAEAFYALINEYFSAGYTIRIPEVTELSDALTRFTRSLEVQTQSEVGVVVFWSEAGAAAPIHYDDVDVIVVQLEGTKRWFISKDRPVYPNKWKFAGETPPQMKDYHTVDVKPGDLIYIPRGTAHTVQSTSESIHIAIGFVPVTIRDAINAALDHYSDLNKPVRMGLGSRADCLTANTDQRRVMEQIREHLGGLSDACKADDFIKAALSRRKTRMIRDLPKLPSGKAINSLDLNTRVRHHPLAICEITVTEQIVDFCQPGEQILIHLGARESVEFIANTDEFRVKDIPGGLEDAVKIALAQRFLQSGFLVLAD